MKKSLILLFAFILVFSGCAAGTAYERYRADYMDLFDTVITVLAYAKSESEFTALSETAYSNFKEMHQLFDIYNDYSGVANIKTINDNAGIAPVKVDRRIIELLKKAKEWYGKTEGNVNVALGSVLNIWHEYREAGIADPANAAVPPIGELKAANALTDIEKVVIDEANSTVFLKEKGMRLDVGALAKGFAAEEVAKVLTAKGYTSVLLSAGGNIRAIGKPLDGVRQKWGVGIKDPASQLGASTEAENLLDVAFVTDTSVVSSGNYERFYTVNGKIYHHIIDPKTLMPAENYTAVTVVTPDSGTADILSTALYILPLEKARALAKSLGVEAMWVMPDGSLEFTEGMKGMLKKNGGASDK